MPKKINLLPTRHKDATEVSGLRRLIRILTISSVVLSLSLAALGLAVIFLLSNQLKNLSRQQSELKTSITSLESTEQSLVLVKDRVQKIQELLSASADRDILTKLRFIADSLPPDLLISNSDLSSSGSFVELTAFSSSAIKELFSTLVKNKQFSSLILEDLKFNPVLGYQFTLNFQ